MSLEAKTPKVGLAGLVVVGLVLSLGWATNAFATPPRSQAYSLTGNTRNQIGDGLPLPITFTGIPKGKVPVNGFVRQTTGPDPKKMSFPQSGLSFGPVIATIGLHALNTAVFQLRTSLIVNAPHQKATMMKSGRTGIATFTWCPGQPLPTAVNPSCVATAPAGGAVLGASMRYAKTTNQFGGHSQPKVGGGTFGGAQLALRPPAGLLAPCDYAAIGQSGCVAMFSNIVPAPTGVVGGPIGFAYKNLAPPILKIYQVKVAGNGIISKVGPYVGPGPANAVKSYGGPWTTGSVSVWAPNALGTGEQFWLKGGDNRVAGVGSISLVAGGVSTRAVSGDNANRGWQNLVVGTAIGGVPSVSNTGLVLLALIFAATTTWMVRRAIVTTN
jgi:hypothetical protein